MKCIESVYGKTIDRVKDDVARTKVATGKWSFCSKTKWKQLVRKIEVSDVEVVESTDASDVKTHGLKAKDRKSLNKKK